jgi:RNA polymerase sigma-70 factor (ECF subfamily)
MERSERDFTRMYEANKSLMFNIMAPYVSSTTDKEDIYQTAMIKAWNNLDKFDETEAKLTTWLGTICRNAAIDFLRVKGKSVKPSSSTNDFIGDEEDGSTMDAYLHSNTFNPHTLMCIDEGVNRINDAIDELPENTRIVAKARFIDDMSYKDIASQCNMPLGTVQALLHRAKKQLAGDLL